MRFLIYGASLEMNFGGPSIFSGLVSLLKLNFEDCHITYIDRFPGAQVSETRRSPSSSDSVDVFYSKNLKLESFVRAAVKSRLGLEPTPTALNKPLIDAFLAADIIVNAFGIDYCDSLRRSGSWARRAFYADPPIVAAKILGKKTAHYTASYGPFVQGRPSKTAARLYLGHLYDVVLCREQGSARLLQDAGIQRRLILAPDTGLLMESRSFDTSEFVSGRRPAVGVSVSHQLEKQWQADAPYLELVQRLCDHMIEHWDADVVLLPNELAVRGRDDMTVALDIRSAVRRRERVALFPSSDFKADELKYLVSKLDMLVASRYHSLVAGLSSGVPTVVLGWHHKYRNLLDLFDQGSVYMGAEDGSWEDLIAVAETTWESRQRVSRTLESHWPTVEQAVQAAASEFADRVSRA